VRWPFSVGLGGIENTAAVECATVDGAVDGQSKAGFLLSHKESECVRGGMDKANLPIR
jgi:hypothetical protein